jgi:hypothetical protein
MNASDPDSRVVYSKPSFSCGAGGPAGATPRSGREIRAILAANAFHGEGYRKIRARLAHRRLTASAKWVVRLMRQPGLLAPHLLKPPNGDPAHAGRIITVVKRLDALLLQAGGVVLVLRGHRPRDRRAPGLARDEGRGIAGPRRRRSAKGYIAGSATSERRLPGALAIRCDWVVHRGRLDQRSEAARHHESVVNISPLRRRSSRGWPSAADVICQTRTPPPQEPSGADATEPMPARASRP